MPDIIRLLPDSVANQIAAGEVIQRPASAVKELLENSIDADASSIRLILKDSGKTLIQVIDNGMGMSEMDARMSFERHATSKIREAHDLFRIQTLGFRGEALASIAAVAQIELKTCKAGSDVGTLLNIEGSRVKSQEPVACPQGTSISVKNLFFNVPARRYFLKSDAAEYRNILEEFNRVALVHSELEFALYHNDKLIMQLPKENLRQRISRLFGNSINEKLLPVDLKTEQVAIRGFIGKPETARKTRGEQYFFANRRFIRHPYLHHAIEQAYQELIPESAYPSYFLFIDVEASTIDVNIHPTKTEVNFQYGQLIYAAMRAAVKHALGMFSISPTLDFDTEPTFDVSPSPGKLPSQPQVTINPNYNPFKTGNTGKLSHSAGIQANRQEWEKAFDVIGNRNSNFSFQADSASTLPEQQELSTGGEESLAFSDAKLFQVLGRYIISNVKSGIMLIDQVKAYERILYERISSAKSPDVLQKSMFPVTFDFSLIDKEILMELREDVNLAGFDFSDLGGGTIVVNAYPSDATTDSIKEMLDSIIENVKKNRSEFFTNSKARIASLMAGKIIMKQGRQLYQQEMQKLVDDLFACQVPGLAPDGTRVLKIVTHEEFDHLFNQ